MTAADPPAERAWTPIDRIAEGWIDTAMGHEPELAVYLGRPGFEGRYADYSPAGADAFAAARRSALAALRREDPLDDVDVITKTDLTRELELELLRHDAGLALRNVSVIGSPVQNIRDIIDLEPTDTAEQWAVLAERLANVPAAVAGYLETLRLGIERGTVPARRQVLLAADEANSLAAGDGFFARFADRGAESSGVGPGLALGLRRGATAAAAAYHGLAQFLERELAPESSAADAVGRAVYELESQVYIGAKVDLDETYEWGLDELARMVEEQEGIAREIAPGASVDEAIAVLDTDPAQHLDGTAALRDWMQGKSDAAIAALGETHFDIPAPLRRLECHIAPTTSGVIYYTPPSDDFARPGRMWWAVPEGVTRFSTWREATTVYHEGVPGHHLQNGIAIANRALNAWRRNTFVSGHGEGWALYAERLMAELGYLDSPAERLGMLDGQRMRAARVVIDIGVHLGKRRPDGDGVWDADFALAFARRHMHMDDAVVRFEVNRYLGWPGQAPSYKVGQRIWESVRDEVKAIERASWDPVRFHKRALELGGVGLDTLRAALVRQP